MKRKINNKGLAKLKEWEGCVLYAYDDADTATPKKRIMPGDKIVGTLTIGYGRTRGVKPGMQCTQAQGEAWLREDLTPAERTIEQCVKVPLTDNQHAALVSFEYNTGGLVNSTLLKKLNASDYNAVPGELMRWVKTTNPRTGKKTTSPGLVNRRAAEAGLWASGAEVASASIPVIPATPPLVTKESVSWLAGAVGTVGAVLQGQGPVQWALAAVIVVGFGAGMYLYLKKRVQA